MNAVLKIDKISKTYGEGPGAYTALKEVSFDVRDKEIVTVVGPSGSGKTTLLKCISGLMKPTSGEVLFQGRRVTSAPEGLAVVFQDYARSLYPWFSVNRNVTLPLAAAGLSKTEQRARTEEALEAVGLGNAGHKKPYELSGGMQQRVAIARALASRPAVLLMDEPFASIDAQTRAELEDLTLKTRDEFDITVLFITHDIDEAVYMADRVTILSPPPTVVSEVIDVPLPYPRDHVLTKESSDFGKIRGNVYRKVRNRHEVDLPAKTPN